MMLAMFEFMIGIQKIGYKLGKISMERLQAIILADQFQCRELDHELQLEDSTKKETGMKKVKLESLSYVQNFD